MRHLCDAIALVPLALIGCTSGPRIGPPIEVLREVPVECTGAISRHHFDEDEELPRASDAPGELESEITVVRADGRTVADLLGQAFPGSYARVVPAAEARRALKLLVPGPGSDSGSEVVIAGVLSTARDGQGFLQMREEIAYVEGFALAVAPGAAILDPQIDIAHTGTRLSLGTSFAGSAGPWELAASLVAVELQHPFPLIELPALACEGEVELQIPVFARVALAARVELHATEALVMTGPDPAEQGSVLVAIVTPRQSIPAAE